MCKPLNKSVDFSGTVRLMNVVYAHVLALFVVSAFKCHEALVKNKNKKVSNVRLIFLAFKLQ